jgi:hypothetical protein
MTPEKFKWALDQGARAITKLVDQKMEIVSKFLRMTAKSVILTPASNTSISPISSTLFFNNKFENELIGEESSCVVFPSKLDMSTFSRWLVAKLLFTKREAKWFTEKRWFKWDLRDRQNLSPEVCFVQRYFKNVLALSVLENGF